jgi:small basic protein (TIGR04137 family)
MRRTQRPNFVAYATKFGHPDIEAGFEVAIWPSVLFPSIFDGKEWMSSAEHFHELKGRRIGLTCRLDFPSLHQSMSQHRSLKGASTIAAKRNVLKRFERVELLKKRGQWKEGSKVIGLPKTKPDV